MGEALTAASLIPVNPPRRVVYVARGRPGRGDRGPLPPGHALSWGAITEGTVLDQAPYPYPVFSH